MHVAICGLSPSEKRLNHDLIRQDGGECWGLPWSQVAHRYDLHFEMHDPEIYSRRGPEYVQGLKDSKTTTLMQQEHADIPESVEYPLGRVIQEIGADYFCSSIAYMLALAVASDQVTVVSVWGVDVETGSEFAKERACNEYLIGLLRGKGVPVGVASGSSMFTFDPVNAYLDQDVTYGRRYGYL